MGFASEAPSAKWSLDFAAQVSIATFRTGVFLNYY